MPVTSYSRTPASNNSAPPNGWPEGQSPGSVNNCGRQLMTDIVNEAGKGAARVLGTVAGTNTITAVMSPTLDAYSAGMLLVFTPANSNTSAATINIDSLGALDILRENGAALAAGDLVVGIPALLLLDSGADDFVLINPQAAFVSGSFTGTLTGYASGPTGTVQYRIHEGLCTLYTDTEISGTSNATTLTMTGLPAAVRPTARRTAFDPLLFNNSLAQPTYMGRADVASAGTITFALLDQATALFSTSGFTASGTKGLHAGWSITYPI
jgi:hypothetical protein